MQFLWRLPLRLRDELRLSGHALRLWPARRFGVAGVAAVAVALLIGIPTVIIPNPVFGRDIPVVAWNYPVWLVTSLLTGMLLATYVSSKSTRATSGRSATDRPGKLGIAGSLLTWFAVGCPVCNKIALLALGYSGALAWFAPVQPFLAPMAIALVTVALLARLRGEIVCRLPSPVSSRGLVTDELSAR